MSATSVPAGTSAGPLTIRPWPDDVIDSLGHDPRSHYVETYWLGILGPPTMASDAIEPGAERRGR